MVWAKSVNAFMLPNPSLTVGKYQACSILSNSSYSHLRRFKSLWPGFSAETDISSMDLARMSFPAGKDSSHPGGMSSGSSQHPLGDGPG